MRVQYRGGLWTNAEDEVVKAAIAKYGRNQWSRIASLLPRKSAKQVKARWCEWLSPDIRKTEWTREEEEKLLHLAKIMPTQWRTIAPMIGRTAAQCLEHYERLLEDAQRSTEGETAGASTDVPTAAGGEGRSRFDEMAAETKPARPDAVDMNEEEKEMLSEARARLANTRGKKAKRKAREKQLEAAKRLAQLQKRRELKAAGIIVKPSRRRKGSMDLTTEVPYMRAPVPGFYDTRDEDKAAANEKHDARGLGRLISKYESEQRADMIDEEARREAMKRKFVFGDPGKNEKVPGARAPGDVPPLKRSKLLLPAPQVSDADLEIIAKAGVPSAAVTRNSLVQGRDVAKQNGESLMSGARHPLLATPAGSVSSGAPVTPGVTSNQSEPWAVLRDQKLQQLSKLQNASTPLVGGDNSMLPKSLEVHDSVTPRSSVRQTPNPLATPSSSSVRSFASKDIDVTVMRSEKARMRLLRRELQNRLDSLPDPENEYVVRVADEAGSENDSDPSHDLRQNIVEDAEDEVKRTQRENSKALIDAKSQSLSSAGLRNLPLPSVTMGSRQIPEQIEYLIERDAMVREILAKCASDETKGEAEIAAMIRESVGLDPPDGSLQIARALVDAEVARSREGLEKDVVEEDVIFREVELCSDENDACWVPGETRNFIEGAKTGVTDARLRSRLTYAHSLKKSVSAAQRNLAKRLHGFETKRKELCAELVSVLDQIGKSKQELLCFSLLAAEEELAVPRRLAELEAIVEREKSLGRSLQNQYLLATSGL